MKNKDIETTLAVQSNNINLLTENQHDLWKRLRRLVRRVDKIENDLKDNMITCEFKLPSMFSDVEYGKLEEAKEPTFQQFDELENINKKLSREIIFLKERNKELENKCWLGLCELEYEFKNFVREYEELKEKADGWKDEHDHVVGICDRQKEDINVLKAAVKAVFNKFDMVTEYADGEPAISKLVINTGVYGYHGKRYIPINIKDYETLAAAWNIANDIKNN